MAQGGNQEIGHETSIDYQEVEPSPSESYLPDGRFRAIRTLLCDWSDRLTLAADLKGGVTIAEDGQVIVDVNLPHEYPHKEGVFVSDVAIKPFGTDDGSNGSTGKIMAYNKAQLTVAYEIPEFNLDDANNEPLIEERIAPTAEFLTQPTANLYWSESEPPNQSDRASVEEAPGMLYRSLDWVYIIRGLPTIPSAALDLVGTVNDSTLTSNTLGFTFAAETLLFTPPSMRGVYYANGARAWDLTFRFSYRPNGWNEFRRSGLDGWHKLYRWTGSESQRYRIYPAVSWAALIGN